MSADSAGGLWLGSEFSGLELSLSPDTGLPTGLRSGGTGTVVALDTQVTLTLGGDERRGPLGGLVYEEAAAARAIRAVGEVTSRLTRRGRLHTVPVELGGWIGAVQYLLGARSPSLTWSWRWRPGPDAEHMRELTVEVGVRLDDADGWTINVPGSRLRPGLALAELPEVTSISSIGGLVGSTGALAATDRAARSTLVVWPRSLDEIGESELHPAASGVRLVHRTGLAAAAIPRTDLEQEGIALDLIPGDWPAVAGLVPGWLRDLSVTVPDDAPAWTAGATIYEAQIGTSIFAGGSWTYAPYPTPGDLLADLPRIEHLGFDTLQIMPRQPFPSYNVVDYDDIELTYGDETALREVIRWSHDHGMRVILDVLLHGVIDRESIGEAADAVRRGPWADLIDAAPDEVDRLRLTDIEQRDLSWSRHVLDFEAAWRDGSAERHRLCDERPEWFCTDSSGRVIGIYTKAFDMSNPQWQDYFCDAMVRLVDRLGIDGFRFDAPTYNQFPNWSPRTRTRASLQTLGSVELFAKLRGRLHRIDPELMMYTEPNGALLRQSMDLNYNYDETWLPASLFEPEDPRNAGGVRCGRELATWLRDRDRTLPAGSVTAHHIDSHDTFWWPLPGSKWRREQFGADAARALMHAFALAGGPYMMFVGGEDGMQEAVARVNELRARRPELSRGRHDFAVPPTHHDELFAVTHRDGASWSIVLVNLSARRITVNAPLPAGDAVTDLLAPDRHQHAWTEGQDMVFEPYQARMLAPVTPR